MAKKDSLMTFVKKAQNGDKDAYRSVINELYDEIFNISAFLFDDEETRTKLTKHLFIKAYKNIAEFDEKEFDIHLWMARQATVEAFNVLNSKEDSLFAAEIEEKEYDFSSIEEDDELGEASAEFNEGFLTPDGFSSDAQVYSNMSIGEKIIYLLYCYEGYTIDEIESIMDIDSSFIMSEVAKMKEGVLVAYAPFKAQNEEQEMDDSDESFEEDYVEESVEDDEYEDDDDLFGVDDSNQAKKKPGKKSSSSDKKQYAIGGIKLTEKELKAVIVGGFAAVVLIVVIIIAVAVSAHNKNKNLQQQVTTKATTTAMPTTMTAPTTQEQTTTEEETTKATQARPQAGTQPDVQIQTTAAQETTAAPQTTAAPETTAATTQAQTTTKQQTTTKSLEEMLSELQSREQASKDAATSSAANTTTTAVPESTTAATTTAATTTSTATP